MKQITGKTKKTCAILILLVLVIVGIIVTAIYGFNKELKYEKSQCIDIYVEQEFDKEKIKEIANQIFGTKNIVETVEIYQDMVTVRALTITEEQKNDFVNKVKENYEFSQTAEETIIEDIASTRIRDMYSQYVLPFVISGILVLSYIIIRYHKIGMLKVIARTIITPVIAEVMLLSVIAITRIPMGRIIPTLFIGMYILSIWYVINQNEKDKDEIVSEEK